MAIYPKLFINILYIYMYKYFKFFFSIIRQSKQSTRYRYSFHLYNKLTEGKNDSSVLDVQ